MSNIRPYVAVRAVVVKDGKILVVNGDGAGDFWCLPGGRVDYGEDLRSAVKREVYEETGLTVEVGRALTVGEFWHEAKEFHVVNVFFACEVVAGELDEAWHDVGGPVCDRRFCSVSELGAMNIFPRWLREGNWLNRAESDIYFGMEKKVS